MQRLDEAGRAGTERLGRGVDRSKIRVRARLRLVVKQVVILAARGDLFDLRDLRQHRFVRLAGRFVVARQKFQLRHGHRARQIAVSLGDFAELVKPLQLLGAGELVAAGDLILADAGRVEPHRHRGRGRDLGFELGILFDGRLDLGEQGVALLEGVDRAAPQARLRLGGRHFGEQEQPSGEPDFVFDRAVGLILLAGLRQIAGQLV